MRFLAVNASWLVVPDSKDIGIYTISYNFCKGLKIVVGRLNMVKSKMDTRFKNIKVLIWDFDGTLYKPNPALFAEVREAEYKTIMELKSWNREKAITEFEKYYKKVTPSATQTVAHICSITTTQAALHLEKYFDRREFLSRDPQLVALFAKLSNFEHYILANGVRKVLEETLETIGIPKETFTEIVTSEVSGENKPSPAGFQYILNKTKLLPDEHLMIGDRESVDIIPAKAVGMKTCLVWSDEKSSADIVIPNVYDVAVVLLK